MKKFLAGSYYFFHNYPDYDVHDYDYIIINPQLETNYQHYYIINDGIVNDFFCWKTNTPEGHIQQLLLPGAFLLDVAHILIPEVCYELGITIDLLKQLAPIGEIYERDWGPYYSYYYIIGKAYIENNACFLTKTQRDTAYLSYKKARS